MENLALDPSVYVAALRAEGAALVAAARRAGPAAKVPSCPDWTVADLLGHVGAVLTWQADIVGRCVTGPDVGFPTAPDDPAARADWTAAAVTALADVLDAADPAAPMWTLAGPGTVAFWLRRGAHETALHRVDAELAVGSVTPVDAVLAADALDEFFALVVGVRVRDRMTGTGESVHVHCTDVSGEWIVRLLPDGPEIERVHAKGDVAARGPASDLLLALRNRADLTTVDVVGDAAVLERFRARASV